MSEHKNNKVNYLESKKSSLIFPIVLLVIVLILSVWLFVYNKSLKSNIVELQNKTAEMELTIDELSNKREIQVYSLIEANIQYIEELEKRSKISTFIKHLKTVVNPNRYNLTLSDFNFSNWEVSAMAIAQSENKIAFEKVRDFIRWYRRDPSALLNLEFVNQIEWMDTMRFEVKFTIK